MFHVVEFTNASGGGIGLIREDWLTPRKKECYWPPYKQSSKFNKCLQNGEIPSDDWNLFGIERIFYSTGQYTFKHNFRKSIQFAISSYMIE